MLGHEPNLQLVAPDHIADDQIVGAVVSRFRRKARHRAGLLENNFVRVQKSRDLYRHLFAALRRPRDQRRLRDIVGHGEADAAQQLDSLGNLIDELVLRLVMLVEQQMQLVERRSGDLPMVLLVHVAQRHGVGKELVQVLDALLAGVLGQCNRELDEMTEGLDLVCLLPRQRLCLIEKGVRIDRSLRHCASPGRFAHWCSTWGTNATAIDPSPTADATRLTLPLRTSPTAKMPGLLVSSRYGARARGHFARASSSSDRSAPVFTKPFSSRMTQPSIHDVFGTAPAMTNRWPIGWVSTAPVRSSRHRTRSSLPSPSTPTISVSVRREMAGFSSIRRLRYRDIVSPRPGPRTSMCT